MLSGRLLVADEGGTGHGADAEPRMSASELRERPIPDIALALIGDTTQRRPFLDSLEGPR
jgi:hypothetical protein